MKNNKKKITIAAAIGVAAVIVIVLINIITSPSGTYYEIGDTSNFVKINGKTITESYSGDTFEMVKDGNIINAMYSGMSVKSFIIDKYKGYDCLFEMGDDIPDYCKSREGAEKIQKAIDDAEQAKMDSEIKVAADAQKKVIKGFDGTNWELGSERDKYDDYEGLIAMEDGNITIKLKETLSEYDEDKIPSTLELRGKYEYNDDGIKTVGDFDAREHDVKIIPETFILDNKERSLEDIGVSINLFKDNSGDTDGEEYLQRTFYLRLNIPKYADDEQFFWGDIGGEFIKK